MASAIARPAFSFHFHTLQTQHSTTRSKSHFMVSPPSPLHSKKPLLSAPHGSERVQFTVASIDVSKEDKPFSEKPNSTPATAEYPPASVEDEKFDKRRPEERFAVLNTGIYDCRSCGFRYDEAIGDPAYPIPPGLPFEKLPEDWRCPTCGAAQSFFESKRVEIAGFAQNQQFGLGANTLTSTQKLVLIYGSLFFFFLLFLGGYFLQ